MGNASKVSKRIRRLRRKYLSVYGEYGNLGLFVVNKIVSECAESIQTHSENTRKEFMRPWRRRKETLGVFSLCAKRYKSVYISVINNTNVNLFKILSNYIIWDRLSQKTISRYCPFKQNAQGGPQGGGELGSAVFCDDCWDPKSAHPSLKQSICAVDCSGGDAYRFRPAGNSVHDSESRGPCL
jgi:hypothetical protein